MIYDEVRSVSDAALMQNVMSGQYLLRYLFLAGKGHHS